MYLRKELSYQLNINVLDGLSNSYPAFGISVGAQIVEDNTFILFKNISNSGSGPIIFGQLDDDGNFIFAILNKDDELGVSFQKKQQV